MPNNKNNSKKAVPKEVQDYYASGKRERVAMAWLIAFGTLVVTVAVLFGLFFGGRWAWRKIAHKNNTTATKPESPTHPVKPSTPSGSKPSQNTNSSSPASNSQEQVNAPTNPTSTTQQPSQSPVAQNQSGKITNTGPGETIATFVVVSSLGAAGHSLYTRRRLTKAQSS